MPIWAQVIVWAAAVITAVTVILGGIVKAFKVVDKITDSWAKINRIAAAVEPNNGKSLYDRVSALEVGMANVQKQLEAALIGTTPSRSPDVEGTPDGF